LLHSEQVLQVGAHVGAQVGAHTWHWTLTGMHTHLGAQTGFGGGGGAQQTVFTGRQITLCWQQLGAQLGAQLLQVLQQVLLQLVQNSFLHQRPKSPQWGLRIR
jgi:hypothetical protein